LLAIFLRKQQVKENRHYKCMIFSGGFLKKTASKNVFLVMVFLT